MKWSNFIATYWHFLDLFCFVCEKGIKSRCWVIWNVLVVVFTSQLLSIFFNERRRKNWNENVVSSSPFPRFLRDLKRTCPSHTLYAAQFKQSSCYVSDFSSNLFRPLLSFYLLIEKNEINGMFVGQQNLHFFFGATVRVWFENCRKTDRKCSIEELPWQPIWYYRRCYHHHPFFQLSSSVISTVILFRFGQMTRGEDATACFESSLFVLSCNVIKKGLFLHRFALCCVTSRRRWRDTFDFNQLLPFTATILSLYFSHKLKTFSTSLSSRQGTRNGLGYNRSISFFSFVVSF